MKKNWKKKASLLVLTAFSMSLLLTGCGGGADKSQAPVEEKSDKVTAGFIYIGPANDGGYSQVHDEGRVAMLEAVGADKVATIVQEEVPEDQGIESVMNAMIDNGAEIIFANSFGYMDYVEKVAKANPDVKFMHFSGYLMGDNYGNYFGRMYQPRYLTGVAAGLTSETGKIGYVAAMPRPEVIRGINAFTLGVRSVNPEATVQVSWTNTWYDPAVEKQAAEALLDAGVDTIAQHQDSTAPQQAAAERGAYSVGYNTDMSAANPEGYISAPVWHLSAFYTEQMQAVVDGTWEVQSYWGGMDDGVVGLSEFGSCVSEETKAAVKAVEDKILAGEFDVFEGEIKDQSGAVKVAAGEKLSDADMLSMMWFVEGVIGTIPQ